MSLVTAVSNSEHVIKEPILELIDLEQEKKDYLNFNVYKFRSNSVLF